MSNQKEMESTKLSSGIAQFSAEFCKAVGLSDSMVASPLSAELILALLALGSSGKAHDEIFKSLHIPDDQFVRTSFVSIALKLASVKGVTFNSANKVYLNDDGGFQLKEQFKTDAVNVFGAEVERINFENAAAAAKTINSWVEDKTNNRIKDLLKPETIDKSTAVVLVNALYFKGTWKQKFNPLLTRDRAFHVNSKQTIEVPTMSIEKKFRYGESKELDAKLLEMPYEGEEASMLVVLPNEVEGLPELLHRLADGVDLLAATDSMRLVSVKVQLPRFKIETEIDLKTLLPKLGISEIFNAETKDLNGLLLGKDNLHVSQAVQKAFIEVNEEGAEAAAASAFGVTMMCAMIPPEPTMFVADRPFLVVVRVGLAMPFWAAVRDNFHH